MEKPLFVDARDLSLTIDIGILDLKEALFYKTQGGFIGLKYQGQDYPRVILRRAFPVKSPEEYVSVYDKENKEIGLIRHLNALNADQLQIVTEELEKRYYSPTIFEVKSVKDKLGYVYMELLIGKKELRYTRNCAVKDVNRNIRMLDDKRLAIFDVDGNRYIVESLEDLDHRSLKKLEPYLF